MSKKDDGLYHFWVGDYEFTCNPGETWEDWIARFDGKYGVDFEIFRVGVCIILNGISEGVGRPGDVVPEYSSSEIINDMHYYIGADYTQIS